MQINVFGSVFSGLLSVEKCVTENIKDCDRYQKAALVTTFHDLLMVAKRACAGPRLRKLSYDQCGEEYSAMTTCDTMEALNCLVKVHYHVMSPYPQWKKVCR